MRTSVISLIGIVINPGRSFKTVIGRGLVFRVGPCFQIDDDFGWNLGVVKLEDIAVEGALFA